MNTVVICAYTQDRWDLLGRAVDSAASQSHDVELVLVIDHNDELLRRSVATWPQHVVVANRFARGLSGARNTGIEVASGEVIAFLDDDAEADSGWLADLMTAFDDPVVGAAGGTVLPNWTTEPPAWFPPEFWWVVGCSYTGQGDAVAEIRNPIGANMAIRRRVFEQVGGFRDEVGRVGTLPLGCEETELSIRARRAGYTVWFRPDAVVHHVVPASRTTIRYFLRRCFAEGMSKAVVSAMVGQDAGLASERTYVSRTLPAAVRRELRRIGRGPDRKSAAQRVGVIVLGVLAACAGVARAMLARPRRALSEKPAPAVSPIASSVAGPIRSPGMGRGG